MATMSLETDPRASLKLKHLHRLAPLCIALLGVFGITKSLDLGIGVLTEPGPGLWPLLLAILTTICGVVLLFTDDRNDYESWSKRSLIPVAGLFGLAVYTQLFSVLGFALSTCLMIGVWLRVFARESWLLTSVLALSGSGALYLIFDVFLKVPFPPGLIFGGEQ